MGEMFIKNKRSPKATRGDGVILDVTSQGSPPWIKFSPFYPHGKIPIPFSNNAFKVSVEGIWQGLKVFEKEGIDLAKFSNVSMKKIKRPVSKMRGKILGHQKGLDDQGIISYVDARKLIYKPCYLWVLENYLSKEMNLIRDILSSSNIILLDYNTNCDIEDMTGPLSHASLIREVIVNS